VGPPKGEGVLLNSEPCRGVGGSPLGGGGNSSLGSPPPRFPRTVERERWGWEVGKKR
jgi:hypothetical protein